MKNRKSKQNDQPRLIVVDTIDLTGGSDPELEAILSAPRVKAEAALQEFHAKQKNSLSLRFALYLVLADMYIGENCLEAAEVAIQRAKPLFFHLVRNSSDCVSSHEVEFFLTCLCRVGLFDEARSVASAAMEIIQLREDSQTENRTTMLAQWENHIERAEQKRKLRLDAITNAPSPDIENITNETQGLKTVITSYMIQSMHFNRAE
ncbi:hypothetical protein KF728_09595 [Candidatus Obscuribacterales bacterium]|nr:hypothetical protein [Candidatus Obscuribacterales bacterium]